MELRVVRSNAVSDLEWCFEIRVWGGQFQAILHGADAQGYPIEDWQPALADAEAYRFYCEMYVDRLLGEAPAAAYRLAAEIPRGDDLIDEAGG